MKRTFFVLVGVLIGFLFGEMLRRKKLEQLKTLEAKASRRKAINEFAAREWQKEIAAMPFEERMDYELWEAHQRLDDWHPFALEDNDEQLP
jgi:hypothetical protein